MGTKLVPLKKKKRISGANLPICLRFGAEFVNLCCFKQKLLQAVNAKLML